MSLSLSAGAADWSRLWNGRFSGNFKSVFSHQSLRQEGVYAENGITLSEQRLRLQGELESPWLRFEIADEMSLWHGTHNPPLVDVPAFAPQPAWDATQTLVDRPRTRWVNRLDRALITVMGGGARLTVGKQVVATGVGHLFSAVSQVPRRPLLDIDPEFPVTEDAVTFSWDGALALELAYLPKVPGQRKDNFFVRAKGSKSGYDLAMTAGRSDDKHYVGLETAGNFGGDLVRAEAVLYSDADEQWVQALAGWDGVLGPSLSAVVEVFYNGFGSAGAYDLSPGRHRPTPYRGRWYLGSRLKWDGGVRWGAEMNGIANLADPSLLLQIQLRYALTESLDLVAGQYLGIGQGAGAEFGGQLAAPGPAPLSLGLPDVSYLLLRFYF